MKERTVFLEEGKTDENQGKNGNRRNHEPTKKSPE